MRTLYITYATWESVALANSFKVYEESVETETLHVWCGTRDVVYRSDVSAAEYSDYNTNFPAGPDRIAVPGEDEALAQIIGLVTVLEPRSVDGTLEVARHSLRLGQSKFLRVDDGLEVMNVNGLAAGSPVVIWNGEATYWTPGDQGSEESYAAHSGTNGWDSSPTSLGQDTKFDHGDNMDITQYGTLSFWMQPKAYPEGAALQVLWKTAGGLTKGNVLSVEDYVTNMDLDVWQKVTIPIEDFALPVDVDKVMFKYASHGGQQFWFDDIELTASAGGGPHTYRVAAPDATERYHLTMAVLILAGVSDGWNSDAFVNIVALDNGLLFRQRRISTAEILWSLNSRDNADLFGRFHPQDDIIFADDVMMMGFMLKPGNASVTITDDDVLEFVVRDNLTMISQVRAFAHYGIEEAE